MKTYKNFDKVLFYYIFSMLVAMLLGVVVLKDTEKLLLLYVIAFIFQVIILLVDIKITFKKNTLFILGIYLLIMIMPCITNIFLNIDTNIYDYLNIIIKTFYFLILFCVIQDIQITSQQFKKFMKSILIIGIISCLYNFLFCGNEIKKILIANSSYDVNVKSFFNNRNEFGNFLTLSLIAAFYLYGQDKNKRKKLLLSIILFSFNSFLTLSRGAIFSTVSIIAYMFLKKYNNNKTIIAITSIIIILLAIFMFTNINIINTLNSLVIRPENFDTGRIDIWKKGLQVIKINPFFGLGYYTSIDIAKTFTFFNSQFHNFFIETVTGSGFCGLMFIISILFYVSYRCIKCCPNKYYCQIYKISVFIMFIKMCIESVSFFSIGYSDNVTTIFYISLPLLLSNMRLEEKNHNEIR